MEDEDWIALARFLKGGESKGIKPVRRFKVKKDMFTFPKGMQCWIAEDGHMYTLEEDYHTTPRVVQMYVAPTIERFSYRFDEFFEELPMLDGEAVEPRLIGEEQV